MKSELPFNVTHVSAGQSLSGILDGAVKHVFTNSRTSANRMVDGKSRFSWKVQVHAPSPAFDLVVHYDSDKTTGEILDDLLYRLEVLRNPKVWEEAQLNEQELSNVVSIACGAASSSNVTSVKLDTQDQTYKISINVVVPNVGELTCETSMGIESNARQIVAHVVLIATRLTANSI